MMVGRIAGWAGVIAGAWLVLALLFTPQTYLINQRGPVPFGWLEAFSANAVLFGVWALLTPLVIWLARRFPIERGVVRRHLPLHAAAAVAVAFAHVVLVGQFNEIIMRMQQLEGYQPPVPVDALIVGYGATDVMIYWGVVAIGQAAAYFRRSQDRELRLSQAELRALRAQLQPHFLFNTLNAIAELVHVDANRADATVTRLSDLLRMALSRGQSHELTLEEEIDFVRAYLEIQQTLLQERLDVHWRIADDALDARVPAMVLQPLVENAVLHGIAPRATGGSVEISAQLEGSDRLRLVVADDGRGMQAEPGVGAGIGIANTRARLRHLYGPAASLEIGPREGGGTVASVTLPFRRSRAADAGVTG